MKKISSRFLPALAAVAIAATASFAVATVVEAQTPPAPMPGAMPPGGPMNHGDRGGPHGGPGMRMMKEVERLKASLQLNANQSALWDRAVATMRPPADMREQMKAQHDKMTAALADPNFDPRRMSAEMERLEADRRAKMTTIREAWFSVYDSLNPAQRGQVREFLRERMSHGMHRMEWKHHGEGHDGPHGGMMPGKPPGDGAPAR